MEPQVGALVMFGLSIVLILFGCHVAFALPGIALIFGVIFLGLQVTIYQFSLSAWNIISAYPFVAVPLFIFMGTLLQNSGVADRLFKSLHTLLGPLHGGLALAAMAIATVFAACTGISGASVITIGLLAMPVMLHFKYKKELIAGTICAGGGLGVIIPPSIVLILYGPNAGISIASLFTAAIIPGAILALMYLLYIFIGCRIKPEWGPPLPPEERKKASMGHIIRMIAIDLVPAAFLILAVLGAIMFGVAAPTEAASLGAVGAVIICAAYGRLNWSSFKSSILDSMRITAMVVFIAFGAKIFTNVFLSLGGGKVIGSAFLALETSATVTIVLMLLLNFVLGMLMDWIGLLFILVPVYVPIIKSLGVDPIWFGILFCITLQISYMTPPFAYSVFYLKGIAPPNVTLGDMYRGAIPFVIIQVIAMLLFLIFPELSLWLPSIAK